MSVAKNETRVPYVAVVLAAGRGDRMGGPKALLAIRWGDGPGELPLAIAHARAHLDAGAERVIVVTRAEVARVLSRFAQRGLDIVVSTERDDFGPAGSIQCALELVSDPDAWVMVVPVDMPPVSAAIRRELAARVLESPALAAVRPVYEGKRGHPVLIRQSALASVARTDPPTSLRDVLKTLGGGVADVAVEDRRAVVDLDTPADVEAFYGHPARFFLEDEPTF